MRLVKIIIRCWLIGPIALITVPAMGQANFGSLTFNANTGVGMLSGTTGGSTSLPAITSNRDRNNNPCLGFGDPNPDHMLILQQRVPNLTLRVNGNKPDMTLVIQGPDGSTYCGDNIGSRRAVSISDSDWQPGSYKIWVGTAEPGIRQDYTLTVKQ